MRVMDLELRTWYGAPGYFVLGATHAVLFWVSVSFLSPLVLLVGLFNAAGGCCTTSSWEPSSSTARSAPSGAGARLLSQIMVRLRPSDHDATCFCGHGVLKGRFHFQSQLSKPIDRQPPRRDALCGSVSGSVWRPLNCRDPAFA